VHLRLGDFEVEVEVSGGESRNSPEKVALWVVTTPALVREGRKAVRVGSYRVGTSLASRLLGGPGQRRGRARRSFGRLVSWPLAPRGWRRGDKVPWGGARLRRVHPGGLRGPARRGRGASGRGRSGGDPIHQRRHLRRDDYRSVVREDILT